MKALEKFLSEKSYNFYFMFWRFLFLCKQPAAQYFLLSTPGDTSLSQQMKN